MKFCLSSAMLLFFFCSCADNRTEIILKAENIDRLTTAAKITLYGFEIGEVEDLELTSEGIVHIKCLLNPEPKIPSDSKFRIQNLDILGSKDIIVELGESSNELKNGEIIALSKMESTYKKDSLGIKIGDFFRQLTGKQKQDSILIELRRLNENLEKLDK